MKRSVRAWIRWLVPVIAVTMAGACDVGEPAPPPEPAFQRHGGIPNPTSSVEFATVGDVLALAWPDRDSGVGRVAGHRLPDGELLWEATLTGAETVTRTSVHATPDRFLVSYGTAVLQRTAAVTTAGEVEWHEPGEPEAELAGGELVLTRINREQDFAQDFVARDPATGAAAWSHTVAGSTLLAAGQQPVPAGFRSRLLVPPPSDWLVLSHDDGVVETVDPRTGATRQLGTLPLIPGDVNSATVAGDYAVVLIFEDGQPRLVGYDLVAHVEPWRIPAGGFSTSADWVSDCGAVICVSRQESEDSGGELHAVDPSTGEVRWVHPGAGEPRGVLVRPDQLDGPLLVAEGFNLANQRIPAPDGSWPAGTGCARCILYEVSFRVLSLEDGSVLRDLADWQVTSAVGNRLLVQQGPQGGLSREGDATLAVVDVGAATIEEVGTVSDAWLHSGSESAPLRVRRGCRVTGDWLVCQHTGGDLSIWSYPPLTGAAPG